MQGSLNHTQKNLCQLQGRMFRASGKDQAPVGQQGVFLVQEGGRCPGRAHWGLFLLRKAGNTSLCVLHPHWSTIRVPAQTCPAQKALFQASPLAGGAGGDSRSKGHPSAPCGPRFCLLWPPSQLVFQGAVGKGKNNLVFSQDQTG